MSVAAAYLAYRPSPYPSSPRRLPGNDFLGSRTTSSGRRAMQPRISTSTKPRRPLDPMQWTDVDLADYVQHHYELPQATSLVAFLEQFRIHPLALWDLQSCHDDLSSLTNGNNALNQLVLRLANQIRPVVSPSTPKPKRAWELSKELDIPSPPPPPPSPLPEEPELDEENNDAESTVSEWALDELTEQEEMQADVGEQPVYVASEQDYSEPAFGGLGLDTGVPSETGYQDPEPQQAEEDLIHFDEETQPEHPTHAAEGGTRDENVEGDAPSAEPPHTDDTAEPAGPLPASTDAGEDDTPVHEEEASQTPTGAETESDLGESGAHVHVHVDESTGDTLPQADEPIAQDDDETQQQGDVHKHDTETPAVAEEHAETSTTGGTSAEEDVQAKTTGSEAAAEDSEEVHVQQETDRSGPEASVSQQDSSTGPNAASVEEQRNLDDSQTTAPVEDEHVSVTPPPDVHASSVQEGTAPAEAEPPSNATPGDSTDSGDQEGATTPQEEAAPTASSPVPETPTDAAGGAADEASPQTTPPADTIPEDEQPTPEEEQVEEEQPDTTEDEQTTTAGEEPSQSNMKTTDTPEPEAAGSSSDPADGTAEQQQQPDEDSSNTADADSKLSSDASAASAAGSTGGAEVPRDAPAPAQLAFPEGEGELAGVGERGSSSSGLEVNVAAVAGPLSAVERFNNFALAAEAMSLGKTPTKEEEPSSTQDAREDLQTEDSTPTLDTGAVGLGAAVTQESTPIEDPQQPNSRTIASSSAEPQLEGAPEASGQTPSDSTREASNPGNGDEPSEATKTMQSGGSGPQPSPLESNPSVVSPKPAQNEFPSLGAPGPSTSRTVGPAVKSAGSSPQPTFGPQNVWAKRATSKAPTAQPPLSTQSQSEAGGSTADQLASAMSESSVDPWRDAQATAAETVEGNDPPQTNTSPTSPRESEPPTPAAASVDENDTSEKDNDENEDNGGEEQNENELISVEEQDGEGGESWQNVTKSKKGKTTNQSRGGTQSPSGGQSNKSRSNAKADRRSRTTSGDSNADTTQATHANRGDSFGNSELPPVQLSASTSKRAARKNRKKIT